MTDYNRKSDCPPPPVDPAPQPNSPGDNCGDPPPPTNPPSFDPPPACPPPKCCKCPDPPTSTPDCLQSAIDAQDQQIALAAKATELKKDLTAPQPQAKTTAPADTP